MNYIHTVTQTVGPANNWLLPYKPTDDERQMIYQRYVEDFLMQQGLGFATLVNTGRVTIVEEDKEGNRDMFRNDTNIEITQRNFILATLQDAWYQKDTLKKDFYIDDDTPPRTAKEMIKRITDGQYVLPVKEEDADENNDWDCPFSHIHWRDPSKKEDRDGYNAAVKQRKADYDAAKATIILKDIVAGQAAMEEFRNKKYN